ncbi:MAG: phage integrase N-terminal SAM-like domain-containing protein [Opitutaceae bacterium]|nr:phage integrase N-terminal SAM-like domain-containing protein [Opitutaceae bacterium]
MQLRGLSPSTQTVYVCAIRQLAKHFHCSPDHLSEEQIRECFLHLTQVRKVSRSNATITLCALKFFYERTLQRQWPVFTLARPSEVKKLPAILSHEEVRRLLDCVEGPTFHV